MFHGKMMGGLTLAGLLACGAMARADSIKIEAEGVPVALHRAGASPTDPIQVDPKIEASAVEPIGDGKYVLIAHDKASEMYIVEAATGKIVGPAVTSDALPPTTPSGPKFEGMARDSKGNYYAVGSHSGKSDDERGQRAHLIRFRCKGDLKPGDKPTIDPASVVRFDAWAGLKAALAKDSSEVEKLKIEGLAIREVTATAAKPPRIEIYIGLREPSDVVRVFATEFEASQAGSKPLAFTKLFAFDAGLREGVTAQLTSLLYVPAWHGFFIVTASEDKDNAFHGNTLWFLADDDLPPTGLAKPDRILDFEVAMKAEGLTDLPSVVPNSRTLRLLVAYDNDAKATHIPSRVQTFRLSR